MEIRVSEHPLPGIGVRYEIEGAGRQRLYVVAHRDGRREVGLLSDDGSADLHVSLDQPAAVTIAALLLGARFSFDTGDARRDTSDTSDTSDGAWSNAGEVVVDVVELADGSPAIGRTRMELDLDDPDAVVLAVVSDSTPELVESETEHRCQVGDRVVVAARVARIGAVAAALRALDPRPG